MQLTMLRRFRWPLRLSGIPLSTVALYVGAWARPGAGIFLFISFPAATCVHDAPLTDYSIDAHDHDPLNKPASPSGSVT